MLNQKVSFRNSILYGAVAIAFVLPMIAQSMGYQHPLLDRLLSFPEIVFYSLLFSSLLMLIGLGVDLLAKKRNDNANRDQMVRFFAVVCLLAVISLFFLFYMILS